MKKNEEYNYLYLAISIKDKVAKRFHSFSKKISKSHSEILHIIMNFFEWHGFLPADRFERSMIEEIVKNRKRTEASIAIIKDIEKSQAKPTNAMLSVLFGESLVQEESILVERKFKDTPK